MLIAVVFEAGGGMAALFLVVFLGFGGGFCTTVCRWRGWSGRGGRILNPYLPLVFILGIACAYLIAKVAYEEFYPCAVVDRQYCDFTSTQYHNLFGWEF